MKVERKVERQRIPALTGLCRLEECARSHLALSPSAVQRSSWPWSASAKKAVALVEVAVGR